MKKYTIIGFYFATGEKFCGSVKSDKDPDDILSDMETENGDLIVCGIIRGHHICVDTCPDISGVWGGHHESSEVHP